MSRLGKFYLAVGFGCVLLSPTPAQAHLVNTNVGEFYAGMMHPLTSLEHLLPTLVLAVLASQCGKDVARWALFIFPLALLAGLLTGRSLPAFGGVHLANLLALVGLGALLAMGDRATRLKPSLIGMIVGVVGLILGYRSGNDMAASQVAVQFIPGVALTGFILITLVAAWVPVAASPWPRALRTLAGVGCVGAGLVLLFEFAAGATLSAARGVRLPGEQELLTMLKAGQVTHRSRGGRCWRWEFPVEFCPVHRRWCCCSPQSH